MPGHEPESPPTADKFVGRAPELGLLTESVVEDRARQARVVCVSGPAGIGKTRLIREFETRVGDQVNVIWTRCWNGPGTPSLWPWSQVLDRFPDTESSASVTPIRDRFQQFEAMSRRLLSGIGETPTVVVVDDIHWADAATLEFIRFCARLPDTSTLSIVLTYRQPDVIANQLTEAVADIEREAKIVRLGGLDAGEVLDLARSVGNNHLTSSEAEALTAKTVGNPFFVRELLRLIPAGELMSDDAIWRNLVGAVDGAGVRMAVEGHAALVDQTDRRVLEAAAIQGEVFDAEVVAEVLGRSLTEIEQALGRARAVGLVTRSPGQWSFEHALIGDVLGATLSAAASGELHRATGEAILSLYDASHGPLAEAAARHLAASWPAVRPMRLVEIASIAAGEAAAHLAWEEQSDHLAAVVTALSAADGDQRPALVDALVQRCTAEKRARRLAIAKELADQAVGLARSLENPVPLAAAAFAYPPDIEGIEIDDIFDPDQGSVRTEAIERLGSDNAVWKCRLQAVLAQSLYWDNSRGHRARSFEATRQRRDELTTEALASARLLDDDESLAIALNARLFANYGPDQSREEWSQLSEELIEVSERLDNPLYGLAGRYCRISELLDTGQIERANEEVDVFHAIALHVGSRIDAWTAVKWRSNLALLGGELDEADRLTMEAFELGSQFMPEEAAFDYVASMSGPGQFLRCSLAEHLPLFQQNTAESENIPAWRVGIAFIAAEADRFDIAQPELSAIVANDLAMLPRDLNFLGSLVPAAFTASRLGDGAAGATIERALRPWSGRLAMHGPGYTSYGSFDVAIGECLHAQGRHAESVAFYERGIEQCAAVGSPYGGFGRLQLGRVLIHLDPDRSRRELDTAIVELNGWGLTAMADRCRAAIEALETTLMVQFGADGDRWVLVRDGERHQLAPIKGFIALRALVEQPFHDVHALEIAALIEGRSNAVVSTGSDPLLDGEAERRFRSRLVEIRADLDRADRSGDTAWSAELSDEESALLDALADAAGFHGRPNRGSTDADRARVNITKHVKRAIDRIAAVDADLGAHLATSVSTGSFLRYAPRGTPMRWSRAILPQSE